MKRADRVKGTNPNEGKVKFIVKMQFIEKGVLYIPNDKHTGTIMLDPKRARGINRPGRTFVVAANIGDAGKSALVAARDAAKNFLTGKSKKQQAAAAAKAAKTKPAAAKKGEQKVGDNETKLKDPDANPEGSGADGSEGGDDNPDGSGADDTGASGDKKQVKASIADKLFRGAGAKDK